MRIAVVGLGSIAQRAYLPILAALENVELVLCSRNREQLSQLAARYAGPALQQPVRRQGRATRPDLCVSRKCRCVRAVC